MNVAWACPRCGMGELSCRCLAKADAEIKRLKTYMERHGIDKCLHPDGIQRRRDGSWCHLCGEVFFGKYI